MSTVSLSVKKSVFVQGHVLTLVPNMAMQHGLMEAIVHNQLLYLAKKSSSGEQVRISYSKLQRIHFPFIQRRWLIAIIGRLEKSGLVDVIDSGRIAIFRMPELVAKNKSSSLGIPEWDEEKCLSKKMTSINSRMQISVPLACKIGLKEAIVLQQVHLRHKGTDGAKWVIRSFDEWHVNTFMFLGIATVKRIFARLIEQNLLYVKKYSGDKGVVNSYRVNYVRIAELLEVELPDVVPILYKSQYYSLLNPVDEINPLYPVCS